MPKDKSSGFYVDKYIIKCSDWKKLLGIKTDWNLPFDDQVQDLCKKAMREEKKLYRERDQNGGMRNNPVMVERFHEMPQFTLATENLRKHLDQLLIQNYIYSKT